MLSEETGQTPEVFHFNNFELRDGKLYYKGKSRSIMIRGGKLRSFGEILKILGKECLRDLGFDIPIEGKLMARQAIMLNKVEKDLPSMSDLAKVDDIKLQEMAENTARSAESLIKQFKGQETLPMHEQQGLGEQLRSIRGSLKVEVVKKVQLEERTEKEECNNKKRSHTQLDSRKQVKLAEIRYNPEYDDGIREDIRK